jgi:hypothetical protein
LFVFSLLGCSETNVQYSTRYFEKGCSQVYLATKSVAIFHLSILALVAAGLVLLALIFYGVVSQRANGGYAVVSRG